jgi:ABC-2 type transport system permease protein
LLGTFAFGAAITNLPALLLGAGLGAFVFSAMGIMFASIPSENPGDVMMPLTFVRIPLLFISGLYIPLEQLPAIGQVAAFFSPLTHTLDLLRYALGGGFYFGIATSSTMLMLYALLFVGIGVSLHKRMMRKQ